MESPPVIHCPSCRKVNPIHEELRHCERCQCDLATLVNTRKLAETITRWAVNRLAAGDWEEALNHASDSWELFRSEESARLAFVASVAKGDLANAVEWLQVCSFKSPAGEPHPNKGERQ